MNNLIMETRLQELTEILEHKVKDFAALDRQRLEGLVTIRQRLIEDLQSSIDTTLRDNCNDALRMVRELRNTSELPEIYKPRLDAILDKLKEISKAFDDLSDIITDAGDHLNQRIRHRVLVTEGGEGLLVELAQQAKANIEQVAGNVGNGVNDIRRDLQAMAQSPEGTAALNRKMWRYYCETVLPQTQSLFRDYVDLLRGLALRDSELDDGISRIGDELLKPIQVTDLHHSLTIPAHQEALTKTVARIIRLSFPEWTIWALPLIAHEFAYLLPTRRDIEILIENEQTNRGIDRRHIEDYFADIFAASSMGPAYACAAVMLRFDPLGQTMRITVPAGQSGPSAGEPASPGTDLSQQSPLDHPSDIRRAQVIFHTLHWVQQNRGELQGFTRTIEEHWNEMLTHCGHADDALENLTDVQHLIEVFGQKLHMEIPGARYPNSQQCSEIAWLKDEFRSATFDPWNIPATADLRDVLNAAWWVRIELWREMVAEGRSEMERRDRIDRLSKLTRATIDALLDKREHPGKGEKPYGQRR